VSGTRHLAPLAAAVTAAAVTACQVLQGALPVLYPYREAPAEAAGGEPSHLTLKLADAPDAEPAQWRR
jgi:hypothetical protein